MNLMRCGKCHYDWAGLKLNGSVLRCPECGVEGPPELPRSPHETWVPQALLGSLPTLVLCVVCMALFLYRVSELVLLPFALVNIASGAFMPIGAAVYGASVEPRGAARAYIVLLFGLLLNFLLGAVFFAVATRLEPQCYPQWGD